MTIPLAPSISLSPSSYSASGQTITASVSVLNRPEYHGKPKITGLTTITPKIVISRPPSGVIPFHVMVSACETTCNAGSAYRDLHYEWDFGDASGTEEFVDQYNGQTVNANVAQQGPESAYLYRTAGTFTITLTVTGKDENGNLITASTTTISTIGLYFPWLGKATGGTYTLTFNGQTTGTIAFDASRATKQSAMEALSNLDSSNVLCRASGCIEFIGALAGDDSISLTGDFSGLTGATGTPAIRTQVTPDTFASVAVSDMSGLTARYVDSNYAGENGASDGTISKPYTTWAHISSFITNAAGNRVCYVKRGSAIAMNTQAAWDGGERTVRIVAYGSGAKPVFTVSSSGQFYFEQAWGTVSTPNLLPGDFVFSELSFVQNLASPIFFTFGSNNGTTSYPFARLDSVVIDSCDYTANNAGDAQLGSLQSASARGQSLAGVHLWGVSIDAVSAGGSNWYTSADQWASVVGGSIVGGDGDLTFDHHLYVSTEGHNLYRWIDFGAGSKSYCINGNCHVNSQPFRYYLVDGCELTGTKNCLDFSNTNNDPAGGYFDDVVVQFSRLHSGGVSPTEQNGIFCYNLNHITIRYCDFWDNVQSHMTSAETPNPTLASIYGCRFWDGTLSIKAGQVHYFHNNVMSTTAVNRRCISFLSGATSVELWDCDDNVYWSENATEPFYNGTGSAYVTLAAWQGYGNDASGSEANPNWSDPDNGIFLDGLTVSVEWPAGFTSLEYSTNDGGEWNSYTNEFAVAIADTNDRVAVLFRAAAPSLNGVFTVYVTSDAVSGDTAEETDSDTTTGFGLLSYVVLTFGSQSLILAVET